MTRVPLAASAAFVLTFTLTSPAFAAPTVSTLALSGQQAAGYVAGFTYQTGTGAFSDPRAGEDGRVTFTAAITGPGITTTNSRSAFVGRPGNVAVFLRGGDPVPGAPAGTLWDQPGEGMTEGQNNSSSPYHLNLPTSAGGFSVAQSSTYQPFATPAYSFAIGAGQPGSVTTVGIRGTTAPGGANLVYSGGLQLAAQSGSNYAYTSNLQNSSNGNSLGTALFLANGTGTPQSVAIRGQPAPGYAAGTTFLAFDALTHSYRDSVLVGPAGQVAVNAQLQPPGGGNDYGIFVGTSAATFTPILKTGDVLPGTGGRTATSSTGLSGLTGYNRAGALFIHASFTNAAGASDAGLFRADAGGLVPVLVGSVQAAGNLPANTRAGLSYSAISTRINAAGQLAFSGQALVGASNTVLGSAYFVQPDGGSLICLGYRTGPALGGQTFASFVNGFAQDDFGDVIFGAQVGGGGATANNDYSFYLWQGGSLSKLVSEGDLLQVAPGDFRTVADGGLQFDVRTNFESTNLSPDGLFTFRTTFTDGSSGVFTLTVPEPSSVLLVTVAGLGALGVAARRRRG